MYTQCSHCKAIFRVTMKELTAAQGLLRCGECDAVFDAMKALSTTLPEERRFAQLDAEALPLGAQHDSYTDNHLNPSSSLWQRIVSKFKKPKPYYTPYHKKSASSKTWLIIGLAALALLLLLQGLYSARNWLAQQPLTASLTKQICTAVKCDLETPRDVRQIHLLSRNVYSHPNTPHVLTISLSLENAADFAQPYPVIEISFLDKENNIVALRRFTPEEYIKNYQNELMPQGKQSEVLLNITDPGESAVHFQFRFL